MSLLMITIAAAAMQTAPDEPGPDDVVVVARRKNECRVTLADKPLNNKDFRARAKLWATGIPARVYLRNEASLQCRLKILRQLTQWNVQMVEFIDPAGRRAQAEPPAPVGTALLPTEREVEPARPPASPLAPGEPGIEMSSYQRQLIAGRAAHLIAKRDCAGAMKLVLDAGDLDAAAKVATICQSK